MMESTAEQNRAIDTQHVGGSASPAELDATPTARRSGDLSSATSPNQVLAIVSVGMILANLDLFVVNVGLPNIALDFANPSLESLSWILNGYTIAYAALLVIFGRLSERYPRNVSFLVGIGTFTAASAACAAATDTEMLVVFRVVQAAAAALMTPTSLGLRRSSLRTVDSWTEGCRFKERRRAGVFHQQSIFFRRAQRRLRYGHLLQAIAQFEAVEKRLALVPPLRSQPLHKRDNEPHCGQGVQAGNG
jgi:hypothetical protein